MRVVHKDQGNKLNLSTAQIKDIAESLECGHLCFMNKANGKTNWYPQDDDMSYIDEDPWQDIKDKIEQDPDNYYSFEPMDSMLAFKVMADFSETIASIAFQQRLVDALRGSKPMRNFKYLIENSAEFRQAWFDFRLERNITWVKEQIYFHIENETE